ncbi:MAG: hypothetical protein H7Y20_17395 [Bryobacteraceae bacterium]|nr:hypothetical protein [Bryobacteraceae bacterium]
MRRNEAEIQSMTESGSEVLTAEVSDRFGDYGLVGVTIARPDAGDMLVDTMLLSCRALGRGVEHQMLAAVGVRAAQQGFTHVRLPVRRTAKNSPALQFVLSLKFGERLEAADADVVLRLPADEVARLQWKPGTETPVATEKPARKATVTARAIDYGRIANELSTVGRILEAMRGTSVVSLDPSMSDTERQVALIWANLLEIPSPARSDNFFDIGGHSLMAVLLLMRIRETFGVELSIDDVYSGSLTLANLAEQIESARTGSMDPEEYASLLAEIEQMSEDEARELLVSESSHA